MRPEQFTAAIEANIKQRDMINGTASNGNGKAEPKPNGQTKIVEPLFVTMDTVAPEKVDWLWQYRIPIGRVTMIDGDPEAGKSFLTLAIAAAVSCGGVLPGGDKMTPSNVLLISFEDGFGDTVRPRLDKLKADVSRIAIPNPKRELGTLINISFIESAVKTIGPGLVVIDPIVQFLGRKDADKAGQVRELLAPLMALAEKFGFACVIVRHLNKQSNTKAMYRGSGSIDFMAACRSAFVVAEDSENGRRIFAHVKSSLGPKMPSLSFYIDSNGFRWGEECETTADDLLQPSQSQGREKHQLEAAKHFLEETLANGPTPSNDIKAKAKEAGISNATLWRAKELIDIKASKERGSGEWWWRLA